MAVKVGDKVRVVRDDLERTVGAEGVIECEGFDWRGRRFDYGVRLESESFPWGYDAGELTVTEEATA